MKLGEQLGIDHADLIVREVFESIRAWPSFAAAQNVPQDIAATYQAGMEAGPAFAALARLRGA
ncbi:MAG TPA: hypothetical protein VF285_02445 [Castellaniella sp.]|uniref:hypothetical protein n=1 Tax=Castellaniella sp. TaxID=1955812 RepID=UPI002F197890